MAFNWKHYAIPVVVGVWVISRFYNSASLGTDDSVSFGSGKMFDKIAEHYDIGNWFMSLGQDQKWRRRMLSEADIKSTDNLLDLATGSADVAIMARMEFNALSVVGLDPSVEMLKVGRSKIEKHDKIDLVVGDAQSMPEFASGRFSKITMSFGIRNVPDRLKALVEMRRVIAFSPDSRLAIMEFSAPAEGTVMGFIAKMFVRYFVPIVGGLVTSAIGEYKYLEESIFNFPSPEEFESIIESAGFSIIKRVSLMAGVVNIYIAKPV